MGINYAASVNSRIVYASEQYHDIINNFNRTKAGDLIEFISGWRARKLDQAYRIYCHYVWVSTGYKQNPPAIYNKKTHEKHNQ